MVSGMPEMEMKKVPGDLQVQLAPHRFPGQNAAITPST
jgi:hypothetical protein